MPVHGEEYLKKRYSSEIEAFRKEICEREADIDPASEYDWYAISLGFFRAKGINFEDCFSLANFVRYTLQYWKP